MAIPLCVMHRLTVPTRHDRSDKMLALPMGKNGLRSAFELVGASPKATLIKPLLLTNSNDGMAVS
jgi:hypothetical protein